MAAGVVLLGVEGRAGSFAKLTIHIVNVAAKLKGLSTLTCKHERELTMRQKYPDASVQQRFSWEPGRQRQRC